MSRWWKTHRRSGPFLWTQQQRAASRRQPLQVKEYASALSQGARALAASGHAAAMAAVVGCEVLAGGDNNVVVKIPKKTNKPAATTTTTTTATATTAAVAGGGGVPPQFCPILVKARLVVAASTPPIQDRKKKRVVVSSSDDDEDTIDVEDAQHERAYAQAEEQAKLRLLAPPAKKAKFTPALATLARVLAELDPANPWVAAANQMLLAAGTAAAPAEAVVVVAPPPPQPITKKASSAEPPAPKAPTKVLVRDKKTGKLTGKIDNVVKRRTMGPNSDLVLRKVQVDIYQKANHGADPSGKWPCPVAAARYCATEAGGCPTSTLSDWDCPPAPVVW